MTSTRSHAPTDYACPFCRLLAGHHDEYNQADDVVGGNELAFARIAPKWWPANPGSALVIPRAHHEYLYDIPDDVGHAVWDLTRRVAVAIRDTDGCDGTSTRLHNEPAGYQDVWHLHVHVFARWTGDDLYLRNRESRFAPPEERTPYAALLRSALD